MRMNASRECIGRPGRVAIVGGMRGQTRRRPAGAFGDVNVGADLHRPHRQRIANASRAPSGLIAGSASLSGPEVSATNRTDADGDSSGVDRDASAKTTAPSTAASVMAAAANSRVRRVLAVTVVEAAASAPAAAVEAPASWGCRTIAISRYPRLRIVSTYSGFAVSSPNARRSSRIARCRTSSVTKTSGQTRATSCSRVTTSPGVSARTSRTCITFGSRRTSSPFRVSRLSDGCTCQSPTAKAFTAPV